MVQYINYIKNHLKELSSPSQSTIKRRQYKMNEFDDDEVFEAEQQEKSVDLDEDDADEVKMDEFEYEDNPGDDDVFAEAVED